MTKQNSQLRFFFPSPQVLLGVSFDRGPSCSPGTMGDSLRKPPEPQGGHCWWWPQTDAQLAASAMPKRLAAGSRICILTNSLA